MIVQSKSKIKEGPDVSPKEMNMGSDDDIEMIMNEIEELRQEMNAAAPPQTRSPGKPPQSPPNVTREASDARGGAGSVPASGNAPSPVSTVEDTEKVEDVAMAEDIAVGEDVGSARSVSQQESIENSPLKSPREKDGIPNEVLDAIANGHEDTISNEVLDAIANGREANRYEEEFVKDIPEVSGEPPWFEETVAHLKKPSENKRDSLSNSQDESQDNSQDNLLTPASSLVMTVQGNMSFQLNYGNERQFVLIQFTQRTVKLRLSNGTELSFPISKKSA